ncbi:MAG TPA: hypothetical protein VGQ87_02215 [Patescibacteria group bacterium]|jgi:stearoyl-CoA desaturase (delta-9 desaturase)|nr:hypothetical protein [Patescibacteria group bacterium]
MITVFWLFSLIPTFLLVSATTVYLHRSATHRSVKFVPLAEWFWKFVIWFTGGPKIHEWVAAHRVHHVESDKEGDPHSPHIEGFPEIQLGNVIYYVRWVRKHPDLVERYSRDITRKYGWWDRYVFRFGPVGITLGTLTLCSVIGWYFHSIWLGLFGGVSGALTHAVTYVFVLTPSINGLCHWPHKWLGGYQHKFFQGSRWVAVSHAMLTFNNWFVALLTGGEGFHYNHHWQRMSARFARNWKELPADWGYWLWILPAKKIGLAYDVKVATWTYKVPDYA